MIATTTGTADINYPGHGAANRPDHVYTFNDDYNQTWTSSNTYPATIRADSISVDTLNVSKRYSIKQQLPLDIINILNG